MTIHVTPFVGVHCETVATGTLLNALGCELSEPLLLGLGQAFGFVYLNLSSLPFGLIGGRNKPFALTGNACGHLGLDCRESQTSSVAKAWRQLEQDLAAGHPVGLQLDCFHLPYFANAPHFAGHFVAVTGLDDDRAEVVDTVQQGTRQQVPRTALQAARHAGGPMSAKARSYTITGEVTADLGVAALAAMRATASAYLAPDFGGMGAPGLAKLATAMPGWLGRSATPGEDLHLAADLIERAGTGGALFRTLYRDFLAEAAELVPGRADQILQARDRIAASAQLWTTIAHLLDQCAVDGSPAHLRQAASLCRPIADEEVAAMRVLAEL